MESLNGIFLYLFSMNKAFTIIELLVVALIMAIFTSILFVDYGDNGKIFALDRAAQKMTQDIRKAQEMAMSGLPGDATTRGYGVYFDAAGANNLYKIYRNNDPVVLGSDMPYGGSDTIKETINLETGIKICNGNVKDKDISSGVESTPTNISISFLPPDPINYIGTNYTGHEASITLCIIGSESTTRTVKVNNAGKIEVNTP